MKNILPVVLFATLAIVFPGVPEVAIAQHGGGGHEAEGFTVVEGFAIS